MAPAAPPTIPQLVRVVTDEDAVKARKAIADLERIERLVTTVLVILGVGGLIFTAVNVTLFARGHHIHWAIAWMLDPLVSVSLLAALFIDGRLSAHGYRPGGWPFLLRWFAGLATWLMNCWGSLYPDAQFTGWPDRPDPAGLLLHSVIPVLVIFLAEAGAGYRKFAVGRKAVHLDTLSDWEGQEAHRLAGEAAKRDADAEAERAAQEAERRQAADLAAREKSAAIEVQRAREVAAANALEIRAREEADARRAERQRKDAEARRRQEREEQERRENVAAQEARRQAEAREHQARIDTESAERAARLEAEAAEREAELERRRILAEAEAAAVKAQADAQIKADERAREERRRAAEARRAQAAETTAVSGAEIAAKPHPQSAEVDDVRGAEAKRKQNEEATFEAAVLALLDAAPIRREFGARYGRSATWGRERYDDAETLMANDVDFAARVLAEAEKRSDPVPAHSA